MSAILIVDSDDEAETEVRCAIEFAGSKQVLFANFT